MLFKSEMTSNDPLDVVEVAEVIVNDASDTGEESFQNGSCPDPLTMKEDPATVTSNNLPATTINRVGGVGEKFLPPAPVTLTIYREIKLIWKYYFFWQRIASKKPIRCDAEEEEELE